MQSLHRVYYNIALQQNEKLFLAEHGLVFVLHVRSRCSRYICSHLPSADSWLSTNMTRSTWPRLPARSPCSLCAFMCYYFCEPGHLRHLNIKSEAVRLRVTPSSTHHCMLDWFYCIGKFKHLEKGGHLKPIILAPCIIPTAKLIL